MSVAFQRIDILDTHTAGEPTRVVVAGGPDLGDGPLAERLARFEREHDTFRMIVVNEPRGSDVMVGALLVPPADPSCVSGVIFFNNVGFLGMCGHGTIGVAVALGHLGRIGAGTHRLETPVGVVSFEYDGRNTVALENVPSYRHAASVELDVPGFGAVTGDVAWGGNWFFVVNRHAETLTRDNVARLTRLTSRIRETLQSAGVTGRNGEEIDHVELVGPPADPGNHARNFVLCPGEAFDRSPCGTGTSAKLACLHADGLLKPGDIWRQESILGSVFEGSVRAAPDDRAEAAAPVPAVAVVVPRIRGAGYVTAEATLLVDPADPFGRGFLP